MAGRLIMTIAILAFAVLAFFGFGPTEGGPFNSFGICFLGLAVLIWFAWRPMIAGLSQSRTGAIDAFARNILGDGARKSSSGGGSNH